MEQDIRKNIVLCITLNSHRNVLIIERANKEVGKGGVRLSWVFPGGKKEKGESDSQAAQRETLEETGYIVKTDGIISEKDHAQFPVHVVYMKGILQKDPRQKVTDPEIAQSKWVTPPELSNYFTSSLDEKVAKYLELQD